MRYKLVGVLWAVGVIVRDLVFATERFSRTTGPYMTRFYLLGWPSRLVKNWLPGLWLQHFHHSDDPVPHNHPKWIVSLILRGGYLETVWRRSYPCGWAACTPPSVLVDKFARLPWRINLIPLTRYHYVEILDKQRGCWTICLVGPTLGRSWGFWHKGRHVSSTWYKANVIARKDRAKPQPVVGARVGDHH